MVSMWWAIGVAFAVTVDGDLTVYAGIQEAIDAAPLGGTVRVGPGTYAEALTLNNDVEVVGETSALVFVEAPTGNAVTVVSANVSLVGLTLRSATGFGLRAQSVSAVDVFDVVIDESILGGVSLSASGLTGTSLSILGVGQHGIKASGIAQTIELYDSLISGVTSFDNGGAINSSGFSVALTDCSLTGNLASELGGAVYVSNADFTATRTTISDAFAEFDGGAIYVDGGNLSLTDSEITDARSVLSDFAMHPASVVVVGGDLYVSGTTLTDADGFATYAGGSVTIEDSSVTGAQANGLYADVVSDVVLTDFSVLLHGAEAASVAFAESVTTTRLVGCAANTSGSAQLAYLESVGSWVSRNDVGVGSPARTLFPGGEADGFAGVRLVNVPNALIEQMTLVGQDVTAGFLLSDAGSALVVHNSLLAYGNGLGPAIAVSGDGTVAASNLLVWDVLGGTGPVAAESYDPELLGADFTDAGALCDLAWWPAAWSAVRDGGDVLVEDLDGTVSALGASGGPDASPFLYEDLDADGAPLVCDCDDARADLSPFEEEVCDGEDDDCDGVIDGPGSLDAAVWCVDFDLDGFGDQLDFGVLDCIGPEGTIADCTDCNDEAHEAFPGADETCDPLDRNCDGDPVIGAVDALTFFADADGDGHGDESAPSVACEAPEGTVASFDDCDDSRIDVHPGADEVCGNGDEDCDLSVDEPSAVDAQLWFFDGDLDGFGVETSAVLGCSAPVGYVQEGADCDDEDAAIHPSTAWFVDADGDGFGGGLAVVQCEAPVDGTLVGGDCDDAFPEVNPLGSERCGGGDEDCDGLVDDADPTVAGDSLLPYFSDSDGDGWGGGVAGFACVPPPGNSAIVFDCDDTDPLISPDASEICGGGDEDCDTLIDDDDDDLADAVLWYADADDDGWGGELAAAACLPPDGTVPLLGDCDDTDAAINPDTAWYGDADGDGYGAGDPVVVCLAPDASSLLDGDCDDSDPAISPAAAEICGGGDEDCDTLVDDGDPSLSDGTVWLADTDLDGFGGDVVLSVSCVAPEGALALGGDCDDGDPDVSPAASELCGLGDEDCDGLTDDDDDSVADGVPWYADDDVDGFGGVEVAIACAGPLGSVLLAGDCDDADPSFLDGINWYVDGDGDGFGGVFALYACDAPEGTVAQGGDCADDEEAVSPAADELCAAGDEDCDGLEADADPGVVDGTPWWEDLDGDGFGGPVGGSACLAPDFSSPVGGDCDDTRDGVNPVGQEVCGGLDEDCDGLLDEADPDVDITSVVDWYADADDDGHGDPSVVFASCGQPEGYVIDADDCDDEEPLAWTDAPESCDGVDNNCDGALDGVDSIDPLLWYADADEDGHGDPETVTLACDLPVGFVALPDDCDDDQALAWTGATEVCDGVDNQCDGVVDEAGSLGELVWYVDADADGFGDDELALLSCLAPGGTSPIGGDCDDGAVAVFPGADELCNGVDDNCDEVVDDAEAIDAMIWYADRDGDEHGDPGDALTSCLAIPLRVNSADDCNDDEPLAWTGADEVCDGVDNDCVGGADIDPVDGQTWYEDADGDGFGNPAEGLISCDPIPGRVTDGSDCDDEDNAVFPGADELPGNSVDEDCDGRDLPQGLDTGQGDTDPADGCNCDQSRGVTPGAWVGFVLLLIRRRR